MPSYAWLKASIAQYYDAEPTAAADINIRELKIPPTSSRWRGKKYQ